MRIKIRVEAPFWLKKRRSSIDGLIKNLGGKTLWVRRLVSGGTAEAESRKYVLLWNGAANITANLVGGNFLVGLYAILHVSDLLLGILTTLIQFCNIFQILSPLLLNRFKSKKRILLVTRLMYYGIFIVVIGLIPFVPGEDGLRVGVLLAAVVFANLINALAAPGYSLLHIRSIPSASRADFFSVLSLLNNICIYVFVLLGGYVVDFFRNRGSFLGGILAVRFIALVFAAVEIYAHFHVHEFEEPEGEEKHPRLNPFMPLKNKEFMTCALLTGLWSFFGNIPGAYYSSYMVTVVMAPYSFLGAVTFLSVPILLFSIPVWNRIIQKISWFRTISLSMLLLSIHYAMLILVDKSNYYYLYTISMSYYFMVIPGVNIVTANLPYYRLPEGGRTHYLSFYASFNSLMTMLGLFCGSVFVANTGGRILHIFGIPLINKQYMLFLPGFFITCLGVVHHFIAKKEARGTL